MSDTARIISCPNCKTRVKWTQKNPYRPFCSERCAMIDLGNWADESNIIAGDADHSDVNSEDLY